jgi:hypothetical protein
MTSQKLEQAVENALVLKLIEPTCPLVDCLERKYMVELEGYIRQFVTPGTNPQIRLRLAGRAKDWTDVERRALIGIFQRSLAGTNTEEKKVAKPPRSCLSWFCRCVSCMVWTPILLLNLCLILGFVGFVVMDERGQDPEFWKRLVTPSVCPAEDRLTDFTKNNLVEAKTQLKDATDKKLTEILVVVNEAVQKVEPRVQFLENAVEEAENRIVPLMETFMETLADAETQQAFIGNNLTVLREDVNHLIKDVQVLRNKTDMQTKEINERQAAMNDLISSLDMTRAKVASFIEDTKDRVDGVWNATNERLQGFEENVTEQLQVTKTEFSQLKADMTLTMDNIKGKLVEATNSMNQLMERLNDVRRNIFPDGGPLFMFYLWLTSWTMFILPALMLAQWALDWSFKLCSDGSKMHCRLVTYHAIIRMLSVFIQWNLGLCFFIMLGAKLIAVVDLIQNNPWVRACVAFYNGIAWLFSWA